MQEKILVTGGAGFIGTHTVIELIQAGHLKKQYGPLKKAPIQVLSIDFLFFVLLGFTS